MKRFLNLKKPQHSYLVGFLQADGHHYVQSRNKGKVTIELSYRDKDILNKIRLFIPFFSTRFERTRKTNFSDRLKSSGLRVCNKLFRKEILPFVPTGKKHFVIKPPSVDFCESDYYRGLVDADGSLGITSANLPFVSLNTSSDFIKEGFINLIYKITGFKKSSSRNKRDNTYNIVVFNEHAQTIVKYLYYENCLGLNRKKRLARKIIRWKRPDNIRRRVIFKLWTKDQDDFILKHSVLESSIKLNRTKQSIKMRLWRLHVL